MTCFFHVLCLGAHQTSLRLLNETTGADAWIETRFIYTRDVWDVVIKACLHFSKQRLCWSRDKWHGCNFFPYTVHLWVLCCMLRSSLRNPWDTCIIYSSRIQHFTWEHNIFNTLLGKLPCGKWFQFFKQHDTVSNFTDISTKPFS